MEYDRSSPMEYELTAYLQTKGLYKALLGKEIAPEEIALLAEDASNEQKTAWDAKVRERNKQIEEIKERNNTVWCHIALALDSNSLLYIRHDCLLSDGVGDGAKAWRLLQQGYTNVEKPTVTSLVRQISRLQLDKNEKLSEYFFRAQELMLQLTEAIQREIVLAVDILAISPSSVVKKVQLSVLSARKGVT